MNVNSLRSRAGYTLVELAFSAAFFTVVILSALAMVSNDADNTRSALGISHLENQAQQMLFKMERELANANGFAAETSLTLPVASGNSLELSVADNLGFPPSGRLILAAGSESQEVLSYASVIPTVAGTPKFLELDRGDSCTNAVSHADNTTVRWAGFTASSPNQAVATGHNGRSLEPSGPVYYRGDGTGFVYQIPVDPAGGTNYVSDNQIQWGSEAGTLATDGWVAIAWVPDHQIGESETSTDINGDGDLEDRFEIGQIRRFAWDHTDPSGTLIERGLGPTAVIQERCDYGSDIDNDGFDDPIFLWDEESGRLHIRMTIIGLTKKDRPVLRQVESIVFLRNDIGA